MTFLIDSGFLYAQLNDSDSWHERVKEVSAAISEPLILPIPAITEVTFLLQRNLGSRSVATFVESLSRTNMLLESPISDDYRRVAEFLKKYADARIDFVDACIAAMAERLNITKILTIDCRDFSIIRPLHCDAFEVFP